MGEKSINQHISQEYSAFIAHVLVFYKENKRNTLPWRKQITPYRVLVSEIMLQQTQVERVVPKFIIWMEKYPNLASLKNASLQEVLLLWKGLGYQRRAKALLAIGKSVSSFKKSYTFLRSLPGVGEYTASAVMAFAYNTFSEPVLETNIRTVLIEHFYKDKEKVDDDTLKALLVSFSTNKAVVHLGARAWYYALMDYGAYLKRKKISHNKKSASYAKQSSYKGSKRELRAKILFSIAQGASLPKDSRNEEIIQDLLKEGFIQKTKNKKNVFSIT